MAKCKYCGSRYVECKTRPGTCSRCGAPEPEVTEVPIEIRPRYKVTYPVVTASGMYTDYILRSSGIELVEEDI